MMCLNNLILIGAILGSTTLAFAQPKTSSRELTTTERKQVNGVQSTIAGLKIVDTVPGMISLAEVRPENIAVMDAVASKLREAGPAQAVSNKRAEFTDLTTKVDAAAGQAARVYSSESECTGSCGKVLAAIESLPGIIGEMAVGGDKADLAKATTVAGILADVTGDITLPGNAEAVISKVEITLGTDPKTGRKLTIDDMIARCLEALRKGKLAN